MFINYKALWSQKTHCQSLGQVIIMSWSFKKSRQFVSPVSNLCTDVALYHIEDYQNAHVLCTSNDLGASVHTSGSHGIWEHVWQKASRSPWTPPYMQVVQTHRWVWSAYHHVDYVDAWLYDIDKHVCSSMIEKIIVSICKHLIRIQQ